MRETLLIVLITTVFFTVANVVPRQQAALNGEHAINLPVKVAARRIANYAEDNLPSCFRTLEGQAAELTRAIIAVEYVSVSQIEHVVEYTVAEAAQLTGMLLPDFSYGPAQVRPSTQTALHLTPGDEPLEAHNFVDDCTSIAIGQEVVAALLDKHKSVTPDDARVLRVIRDYTGQLQQRPEHIIHNAIVAQLYADYQAASTSQHIRTLSPGSAGFLASE